MVDVDWKKSLYYKSIVGEIDSELQWQLNDELLTTHECESLLRLITKFKEKRILFSTDELAQVH